MEKFLHFWITYNEVIIQWVFLAIILAGGYLLGVMVFAKRRGKSKGAGLAADMELPEDSGEVFVRILEKMQSSPDALKNLGAALGGAGASAASTAPPAGTTLAAAHAAASAGGPPTAAMEALNKELAAKASEVAQLKAELEKTYASAAAAAAGGAPAADDSKLLERIKELEGKLSEYEILEDDIADLSMYKEENSKLKQELASVKGGGGAVADAPKAAADAEEPLVEEFAAAAEAVDVGVTTDEMAQVAKMVNELDSPGKDPMDAFEEAVSEAKQAGKEKVPLAAQAAAAAAAAEAVAAGDEPTAEDLLKELEANGDGEAAAEDAETEEVLKAMADDESEEADVDTSENKIEMGDDILAEFAASIDGEGGGKPLDTDKMLSEMAGLENAGEADGSDLESAINTDKMADEASNFKAKD